MTVNRYGIRFIVDTEPVPQGNMKAFAYTPKGSQKTQVGVTSTNAGPLGRFRTDVRAAAQSLLLEKHDWQRVPKGSAVGLLIGCYFERPAKHYLPANTKRASRVLREDAPLWHTQEPDGDKLGRAVGDALTGMAYDDDAQVASITVYKQWSTGPAFLTIGVMELDVDLTKQEWFPGWSP